MEALHEPAFPERSLQAAGTSIARGTFLQPNGCAPSRFRFMVPMRAKMAAAPELCSRACAPPWSAKRSSHELLGIAKDGSKLPA